LTKLRYNVDHLKDQVATLLDGMEEISIEEFIEVEEGSNEAIFDIDDIRAEFAVVQSADWTIKVPTSLLEGGEVAKVSLKVINNDDLPSDIRTLANGKRVISLELHIDGVKRSDFNGNIVTVSVDYVPAEGEDMSDVTVWYMNENELILDKCENARFDASSNRIIFDTTHFSYWMIGHEGSAEPEDDGGVNKIVFIVIGVVAFAALGVVFFRMKR
jgi:endo-1,4-beta-xylanase